jgi:hypothetical protein
MDASSSHTAGPNSPPTSTVNNDQPRLVKPDNVKSRFWAHFMKYDPEFHPDKLGIARCTLCGREISVRQGTGGLKNHMKFKHPSENALLLSNPFFNAPGRDVCSRAEGRSPAKDGEVEHPPIVDNATTVPIPPRSKKPRLGNSHAETSERRDDEKRRVEKHLMEMWSLTRKEIRQLRAELKDEEEGDIIREMESDLRVLQKRKAHYADLLGFLKDEEDTSSTCCTERVADPQARGRANAAKGSRTATTTASFEDYGVNADRETPFL